MMLNEKGNTDGLSRILVVDRGVKMDKKGNPCHRMNFVYACDLMEIGRDVPVAYPFLLSSYSERNGKIYRNRDYYLPETSYDRLMRFVQKEGCENSKYAGVVEVQVREVCEKGTQKQLLNLTKNAISDGLLRKPEIPFYKGMHEKFLNDSKRELESRKKEDMPAV